MCSLIFGVISNLSAATVGDLFRSLICAHTGRASPTGSLVQAHLYRLRSLVQGHLTGSLGVALRPEPRDLAVSVHPVVGICLAGQPRDFALFAARIVSLDCPVVICDPNGLEGHFCFCHEPLCTIREENTKKPRTGGTVRGFSGAEQGAPCSHMKPASRRIVPENLNSLSTCTQDWRPRRPHLAGSFRQCRQTP